MIIARPQVLNPRMSTKSSSTKPVTLPSTIDEFLSLRNSTQSEDRYRYEQVYPYVYSSLVNGRHLDRAVVVMFGESGHGKSKTINRLIGDNRLSVARRSAGSTTKVPPQQCD